MRTNIGTMMRAVMQLAILIAVAALTACSNTPTIPPPSEVPLSKDAMNLLAKKGMQPGSPVFVRIFKEESELEHHVLARSRLRVRVGLRMSLVICGEKYDGVSGRRCVFLKFFQDYSTAAGHLA